MKIRRNRYLLLTCNLGCIFEGNAFEERSLIQFKSYFGRKCIRATLSIILIKTKSIIFKINRQSDMINKGGGLNV